MLWKEKERAEEEEIIRNTYYVQSADDIREIEEGRTYCEFCLRLIYLAEDPDRFGNYELFIEEDEDHTQLLEFLCTDCVKKENT